MSLSKIYSTQDTFEPENIVRAKLHEPPVFGSILTDRISESDQKKQGFQPTTVSEEKVDHDTAAHRDQEEQGASFAKPPEQQKTAPQKKIAEPAPPAEKKAPAPPPPPPGVPQEEVQQMVADSYENGLQEGLQQAEEDFGAATKSLLLICQQLDTLRETILKNSVGEMQGLVLAIAEKIIRHSVQEQTDTVVDTVEEAINKAVKSSEFYIYVNPEDYETVAAKSEEFIAGINGLDNVVVKKDKTIDRGGCRIESDNCTVDATLTSQLDIIRDQLKQD